MRQAEKHNWNYQNKNSQFVSPVEPSQETNPEQDQDPFMTPQISPPKINAMAKAIIIQGIKAEAAGAVVEKVADLRTDRKSFSIIFMAMSRIIQPISVLRKREP